MICPAWWHLEVEVTNNSSWLEGESPLLKQIPMATPQPLHPESTSAPGAHILEVWGPQLEQNLMLC